MDFYVQPVNRYESQFINTLADAVKVRRRIKDHPHVKIAPDTFHMALEEIDPAKAIGECAADIGYVHVADSNHRLPGRGLTNFAAIATALKNGGYDGWITLSCGQPGHNAEFAKHILDELPASIEVLKQAGF